MTADHMIGIEGFETGLWKLADNLRANSNLASNEYFMPIMGLIFLRHATNRFYEAKAAIEADKAAGKMPNRPLVEADFTRRRALKLPERACFDVILKTPKDGNLGAALTSAMEAIEAEFPPLAGQLPKDYGRFEGSVLEEMMRMFDTEGLRNASGDVFGRIYEYFLAEFSKEGAHDNGEFFTPPSIVQTIVNVIEPDHGVVLDPACGSGGMFVQSSHFIEDAGQDTMKRVTFYGHEKNETTAKLAQINLAVHGLQGNIKAGNEAITYYKDPHELVGKCDFVMANPPFNVDEVDAEKVKGDTGLHPLADRCRDLTKQIDLAAKLAGRVIDIAVKELAARDADTWNNAEVNRARKTLDEARADAVDALRRARYWVKQSDWLQERFPNAVLRDVEGLVKRVNRATIAAHDWSLTPGRYVGVAPEEQDEDFDFEETLRAIHIDLKGLNEEAAVLATRIALNFEELGV
jgi:type I restriction-modification system DNA methylase subunit